jgi:hypothetical protein
MKDDTFLTDLAGELYAARATAAPVKRCARQGMKAHDCHANVDRWVKGHPACEGVRGWLVYEDTEARVVRFQAHSVIRENGILVDITPTEAKGMAPFMPHPDGNEMFDLILSRRAVVMVAHRAAWAEDG